MDQPKPSGNRRENNTGNTNKTMNTSLRPLENEISRHQ